LIQQHCQSGHLHHHHGDIIGKAVSIAERTQFLHYSADQRLGFEMAVARKDLGQALGTVEFTFGIVLPASTMPSVSRKTMSPLFRERAITQA